MNPKTLLFFGSFSLGVALDQATKYWVNTSITGRRGEVPILDGWLSLVHSENPGAVFGSLGGVGEWRVYLFLAFTVVAIGIVGNLWWKLPAASRFLPTVYGVILSGAVGNGIDRVIKGTVTDFLLVYTDIPAITGWLSRNGMPSSWPAFNVADIALSVGVGLFVVHELFFSGQSDKPGDAPAPESR